MSWFWGTKNKGSDPTKSLEPDLKDFLDKQQHSPYVPAEASKPPPQAVPEPTTVKKTAPVDPEDRPLPKESLYQDGRYKHLWKTYVPPVPETDETTETTDTKTPAERVLSAKRDRRQMIHRAAMENCVFEQEMQQNCFVTGDTANRIRATMTMCRQETKAFNRCYQLQAKFLQALGYLGSANTTSADEEIIQMHADKLYHRMMDYEAAVDEAKNAGKPVPPLTSVFNPGRPAPTVEDIKLPAAMEKSLQKPLREMPPHERELAAKAVLQEAKVAQVYADDLFRYTTTLNEDRKKRQQFLVSAFGEVVGKFLIADAPDEQKLKKFDFDALERTIWKDGSDKSK